jgi:hypothetical protein
MRFNRNTLLAAGLGLGIIGLVATADPPTKSKPASAPATPVVPEVCSFSPPMLPKIDVVQPVAAVVPLPALTPEPPLAVVMPVPVALPVPVPVTLPTTPMPTPTPKIEVALPTVTPAAPTVALTPPDKPEPKTVPGHTVTTSAFQRVSIDFAQKPLKFEISTRDSSLSVSCESIEVRMPGEQNTTATPLKATGNVRFTAPGCHGTCDELCVFSDSGMVMLQGNVRLYCRQGDIETEVTGSSVKFRLGKHADAPGLGLKLTTHP